MDPNTPIITADLAPALLQRLMELDAMADDAERHVAKVKKALDQAVDTLSEILDARTQISRQIRDASPRLEEIVSGRAPACLAGQPTVNGRANDEVLAGVREAEARRTTEPDDIPDGPRWSIRVCRCCKLRLPSSIRECPRCCCSNFSTDEVSDETHLRICKLIDQANRFPGTVDDFWGPSAFWTADGISEVEARQARELDPGFPPLDDTAFLCGTCAHARPANSSKCPRCECSRGWVMPVTPPMLRAIVEANASMRRVQNPDLRADCGGA